MNTTFLKNISLSLGTLLVSSQILAIEDLDKRISKLETQMNQVSTETALGTYGAKSGTANPSVESGVFLYGDLLYWHVYEGSAYNYTQTAQFSNVGIEQFNDGGPITVLSTSNTSDINEDARHVNFRWDFGFKAGIGYQLPHDDWDAGAEFTYFRTKGNDAQSGFLPIIDGADNLPNTNTLFSDLTAGNTATKSTKTEWKLDFYNINFTFGRNYFISHSLSLHPFAGIQTAWIRQNLTLNTLTTENENNIASGLGGNGARYINEVITNKRKNRFWGIGPRFGFDTKWYLNKSVGIYGSVAGGIIWGEFDITKKLSETDKAVRISVSSPPVQEKDRLITSKVISHPHRIVANAQLDLGISWEFFFTSSDSHLELRAGYENQYWWRQNYIGVDTLTTPDDLGFHGGLFEAKFDF